jgi:predicted metal-dependent phosphoesterase TrpH
LQQALSAIRKGREDRNLLILEKLAEHGFPLSMEEVLAEAGGETVARPHIAKALVRKGYAASIHDVFSTMLGCSKPMYVPRVLPSPAEVMAMAENEGATTVFAHPMLLRAPYEWLNDFISELSSLGLDALEAWHSEQDAAQTRSCIRLAEKHKLALSGGSDYHGSCKPHVALGTGRGNVNVPYSILEKLLKLRKIKKLPQYAI